MQEEATDMPLQSKAVHNPNGTPEDDHVKWLRVREVFEQHFKREQAEKKNAGEKARAKNA